MVNKFWAKLLRHLALAQALWGCARLPATPEGYQGIVEYDERLLAFEVAGRIERVVLARGDRFAAGALLAEVDATLQRLVCESRRAALEVAEAELALLLAGSRREDIAAAAAQVEASAASEDLARKSYERARSLSASGSVPREELDRATADLARFTSEKKALQEHLGLLRRGSRREELLRARARVAQARSTLRMEEERLDRHRLRAQSGGEVLDLSVEAGELASVGSAAALVADTTHPRAEVFVPQGELDGIRIGMPARVRSDASKRVFAGKVEHIAATTEFTPKFLFSPRERPNLVVRVRVRIDDPGRRLHAGVPAFVSLRR